MRVIGVIRKGGTMLKVYIDGKHFQDQMRQCKIKEGQVFHLKLVKIAHDRLGQWDIYFESLPAASQNKLETRSRVNIYQKPVTDEDFEGQALLYRWLLDIGDGYERWLVEFPKEPDEFYERTVHLRHLI